MATRLGRFAERGARALQDFFGAQNGREKSARRWLETSTERTSGRTASAADHSISLARHSSIRVAVSAPTRLPVMRATMSATATSAPAPGRRELFRRAETTSRSRSRAGRRGD